MVKELYFFIGTEAELIKVFPVIMQCQKKGVICNMIASGQNDLKKNRIMDYINLSGKYVELSQESDIKKSAKGLFSWFIATKMSAKRIIQQHFEIDGMKNKPMIVHGDTVSTFMGALVGKQLHMNVCHIEAGLRSHNLLNPFPEEIDRLLTSRIARVHFAPGLEAVQNLRHIKGKVINTKYNTILDSLKYSENMPIITDGIEDILSQDYFVFVMHRQENLLNKEFVRQVIEQIKESAASRKCVLILHKITESTLEELGLLSELKLNKNFVLFPRVDYFDFMKLLDGARYVITDGGSNQEELYYMGKPCLIMRKTTERSEGISKNAVLFGGDINSIASFAYKFTQYVIPGEERKESPSIIISDYLAEIWKG